MGDVAQRLQEYAQGHVRLVQNEYQRQLAKWSSHLSLFADAQLAARTDVESAVAEIKRQKDEEDRLLMLATSVLLASVATWVGAVIELKLYPRFMSKKLIKISFEKGGMLVKTEKEYIELAAKFFGDFTHENIGHVFDALLEKVWPKAEGERGINSGLAAIVSAGNIASFKSTLEVAFNEATAIVFGQLGALDATINQYKAPGGGGWGDLVLGEVQKRFPRVRNATAQAAEWADELNGRHMLDEYFDSLRSIFAREWFYYGNNPRPGSLHYAKFNFAIEFWALFVLTQEWVAKTSPHTKENWFGEKFYVTKEDSAIDLVSIMAAVQTFAGQQIVEDFYAPKGPIKSLGSKGGTIQDIDVDLDQAEQAARTASTAATKTNDADTNLGAMQAWAMNVPISGLHGQLDAVRRNIGSVTNPGAVLAS